MSDERVSIDFDEISRETEAAVQIVIDDKKHWLPKSQIMLFRKTKKVSMPEWITFDKGLI